MKITSTIEKPIFVEALDMELPELFIDYEVTRKLGGNSLELICFTFKNQEKRDQAMVILTNIPSVRMIIQNRVEGIFIKSSFFEVAIPIINETFELSTAFIEKCIKKCYQELGYTIEE
jgi:hypothetical protein